MKLTYYHTLYKSEVTITLVGDIVFEDGFAIFAHMGRKQAVELQYIRKIEPLED